MATNNQPKLDALPIELLHKIAGFLSCSSALCLVQVSQTLRHACDDRLVFKYIAQTSHMGLFPSDSVSAALLEGRTLLETKQAALAMERAVDWYRESKDFELNEMEDPEFPTTPELLADPVKWEEIRLWLPQFTALHHPCALQANPVGVWRYLETFRDSTYARWGGERGFCSLAFSFIAAILEQNTVSNSRRTHAARQRLLSRAVSELESMMFLNFQRPAFRAQIGSFLDMNPHDYSMAILIHYIQTLTRLPASALSRAALLPLPSKIPFATFMAMPGPMQLCEDPEAYGNLFPHIDLHNLLESGFMCSGEWEGYYSYDRQGRAGRGITVFDPPMRSIVFSTRYEDTSAPVIESTTGVDSVGGFTLLGSLRETDDGRVLLHLAKTYTTVHGGHAGHSWEWRAWVTPFGIVGAWGNLNTDVFQGYLWLWKKEWCSEA